MSISCGFYNSINGDRRYDAIQMASIFDGLISDGVFSTIGNAFTVNSYNGLTIHVGTGKAWFNHTWTINDSILPLTAPDSDLVFDRIDAVVLEVNSTDAIRNNTIKIVTGTPSRNPEKPILQKNNGVFQYPLCYIHRPYGSTKIIQSEITPAVGTDETPFVTAMLQTISLDLLLGKWQDELDRFVSDKTKGFNTWFDAVRGLLTEDATSNLLVEIQGVRDELVAKIEKRQLKRTKIQIRLDPDSWDEVNNKQGFRYKYIYLHSSIKETDILDIFFDMESYSKASESGISYIESGSGFIELYCMYDKPRTALTCVGYITKGEK